jgi:hypothetical protein
MWYFTPPFVAHDPRCCGRIRACLWLEARRRQGRFDRAPGDSLGKLAAAGTIRRPLS